MGPANSSIFRHEELNVQKSGAVNTGEDINKMTYKEEINRAMRWLAEDSRVYFIGQSVRFKGTGLFHTLENVPMEKRIELPVFEDIQMGMTMGMSLEGLVPVSIYPRMDFLIIAANELVNHLDKMEDMSEGQFKPKVIIRTAIGSIKPLFPGPQHNGDYCEALQKMLKRVKVVRLEKKEDILPEYKKAYESDKSTILVEMPDLYET